MTEPRSSVSSASSVSGALSYAYAIVGVFSASVVLLVAVAQWSAARELSTRIRIERFHLRTLSSTIEITSTVQQILDTRAGASPDHPEILRDATIQSLEARLPRLVEMIQSRLGFVVRLEENFPEKTFEKTLARAVQKLEDLRMQMREGTPIEDTLDGWRGFQRTILQLDRLHRIAMADRISQAPQERRRHDQIVLGLMSVIFLIAALIVIRLVARLRASLQAQESSQLALLESERQLQQAQKLEALGTLVGGVAHDFNNLLTVVQAQAELLALDIPEADPRRASIDEIEKVADRGVRLTRQLLTFSRQEQTHSRSVNLNTLLRELQPMLQRVIRAEIATEFILAEPLDMVRVDPSQIEQVIVNIVVNALDAMRGEGKLTIETSNERVGTGNPPEPELDSGEYVRLSISDTGCGMSEAVRQHLFEPFFTTKERGRGTGLGLAVVIGIVQNTGGHIEVSSQVGQGSRFDIWFPKTNMPTDATDPEVSDGFRVGRETVLLVEDEHQVRRSTAQLLRRAGYEVLPAATPSIALDMVESYPAAIHLLVSDVILPGLRGPDLAKQIRARVPEIQVIFFTGYSDDEILNEVRRSGCPVLAKPFRARELLAKVRNVLDAAEETASNPRGTERGTVDEVL